MALKRIPVRNDLPAYSMRIELSGEIFALNFRYNQRSTRWIMDILTEDETPILEGVLLRVDVPLLSQYFDESLPEGDFIVLDRSNLGREPNRDNFGDELELFYNEV